MNQDLEPAFYLLPLCLRNLAAYEEFVKSSGDIDTNNCAKEEEKEDSFTSKEETSTETTMDEFDGDSQVESEAVDSPSQDEKEQVEVKNPLHLIIVLFCLLFYCLLAHPISFF